jgi:alkylation response protein AidB-like acyl-CoA dehydrogenase
VRDGDDWIVNGQKIWTTGAHFCDWGILVVRSDPTAAKHAGLTYFVVDMHAPGVEIRPITQINGGQGFNEVFFTDVRVPDDAAARAPRRSTISSAWPASSRSTAAPPSKTRPCARSSPTSTCAARA